MNKKIHSPALLVNLGIYGVAQAQEPTDTPVSHDDTIVVTAAEQNLQAPAFRPSPQMKSAKPSCPRCVGDHPYHAALT